eukprot:GHUV01029365.1.p3 GENE.GHUV01029365.1~~GHUV01029365.1.p3  ORF type:complete len:101 (-),score=13.19 GHUV01029365.1:1334-1636(-)
MGSATCAAHCCMHASPLVPASWPSHTAKCYFKINHCPLVPPIVSPFLCSVSALEQSPSNNYKTKLPNHAPALAWQSCRALAPSAAPSQPLAAPTTTQFEA